MALVKEVSARLKVEGYEDAKLKIDRLNIAAKEFSDSHPTMRPEVDGAKALLEARLLREGIKRELSGSIMSGGGGGIGGLLSGAAPNLSGLPWGLGAGGGAGLAAAVPAAGAALVEVTGLVSGLAAATAGVGAFGILSAGTFSQLKQDVTQYQAAWDKLNQKQNVLAVTQANFAADPTKANKTALASAQKAEVTAQTNLQATFMGLGQDAGPAAAAINTLRLAYDKLSASLQPLTFKVVTDATKAVTTFLPNLLPFAQAGGQAIDGLLKHVTAFFQTADFKKWLDKFLPLVGPSITALGDGIGKVLVAVGNLFTKMSSHDVVHAINIAFDLIAGIINGLGGVIARLMSNWDRMTGAFREGWKNVTIWTREAEVFIARAALDILNAFVAAFGWIPGIGPKLKTAQAQIQAFVANVNGQLASIHDKTVTITVQTFYASPIAPGGSTYRSQVPAFASGGIVGAASGGIRSGTLLVGENGPELVHLPGGSTIYPSGQTRSMLGTAGDTHVHLWIGDREIRTIMKRVIRTGGGDPSVMGR